jgi:hypothetical protein
VRGDDWLLSVAWGHKHGMCRGIPLPQAPFIAKHVPLSEHNRHICVRYAADETLEEISSPAHFGEAIVLSLLLGMVSCLDGASRIQQTSNPGFRLLSPHGVTTDVQHPSDT